MVIDIELTLNRFGFGKISENKFQLFCFRFSIWKIPGKYSISFEINWRSIDSNAGGMNKASIIYSILAILFGVFMFVYGGIDDSPGGQLLVLLLIILGVLCVIKSRKSHTV